MREAMYNLPTERSIWMAQKKPSTLNAFAPPFPPPVYPDHHCLFLTFSNGFPLTEYQVFTFFYSMFGPYVEFVYVNKPKIRGRRIDKASLYGKVVFNNSLIPNIVMGPYEKVFFSINGRAVHCKRFVSNKKPKDANAAASSSGYSRY